MFFFHAEFSNSSELKSVFEKLRFRVGLVWAVGVTVESKATFPMKNRYHTTREAMSAISVFQVKFDEEFTRQAVNFSIELSRAIFRYVETKTTCGL